MAFLVVILIGSFLAYHKERQRRSVNMSDTHQPPGGGNTLDAPVKYQVDALRQAIRRISETGPEFDFITLRSVMQNLPRTGTDPIYEPLDAITCQDGLCQLVSDGELEVGSYPNGNPGKPDLAPGGS